MNVYSQEKSTFCLNTGLGLGANGSFDIGLNYNYKGCFSFCWSHLGLMRDAKDLPKDYEKSLFEFFGISDNMNNKLFGLGAIVKIPNQNFRINVVVCIGRTRGNKKYNFQEKHICSLNKVGDAVSCKSIVGEYLYSNKAYEITSFFLNQE